MMTWTRNAPTSAGFWWYRGMGRIKVLQVESLDGVLHVVDDRDASWGMARFDGGEWSSTPIAEPTGGNDAVDR